jgi:hypothetical protein
MRRTVHKYETALSNVFTVELPHGAQILTLYAHGGDPFLYALIDADEKKVESVSFRLANTGDVIEDDCELRFVDTFQLRGAGLVYHLFERIEKKS